MSTDSVCVSAVSKTFSSIQTVLPPAASAPSNLMAVQECLTGIRVSWSSPSPLGDTTGYRISYSDGSSGTVDVSDGSTDNYLLICLQNGERYTVSIVSTSLHLPSETVYLSKSILLNSGQSIHCIHIAILIDVVFLYFQFLTNQSSPTHCHLVPTSSCC